MKNMFIIHGYQASTESHWFEWLATQMKSYDYHTEIVYLPNTNDPDLDAWDSAIQHSLNHKLDKDSIIVAHSLRCLCVNNCVQLSPKPFVLPEFFGALYHCIILYKGLTTYFLQELAIQAAKTHLSSPNHQSVHIVGHTVQNEETLDNTKMVD